jgi:dephospho-CoA kinase
MAAGKNTVSSLLEEEAGWLSVDFDDLVHNAIERVTPQIFDAFSADAERAGIVLLKDDGSLDRRALGSLIFNNADMLARQEQIVYPEVNRLTNELISSNTGRNIILNATVLYKIPGLMKRCRAVLYVTAPYLKRLFRTKARDNMPCRQIAERFHTQKNLYKNYVKTGISVIKINNSGSLPALRRKTGRAIKEIIKNT